jgi:hypothetical protein
VLECGGRSPRRGATFVGMHGFSTDGESLFIVDGFGLTQLRFSKTVKTDAALAGEWLSIAGDRFVVRVSKTGLVMHRTVASQENLRWRGDNSKRPVLLHDATRAIDFDAPSLTVRRTEKSQKSTLPWPDDARSLGDVTLGPAPSGEARAQYACAVNESGRIAHYSSAAKRVFIGSLRGDKKLVCHGALAVGALIAPPSLVFDGETLFVCAFDAAHGEAKLCAVTGTIVSPVETLKTISAPTFSGTHWCWQPSYAAVLRARWNALREVERFALPAAARGAGVLMAHREARLCFMQSNGERVYDLCAKTAIERKLSKREHAMREVARTQGARLSAWLGVEGGALTVANFEVDRRNKDRATWSPVFDLGRGTLSAFFAFGDAVLARFGSRRANDGLDIHWYTSQGPLSPCSLDDVRRAFAAIDRHEGDVRMGLFALEAPLSEAMSARKKQRGAYARVLDEAAAKAVLTALFRAEKSNTRAAVKGRDADAWAEREVSVEWLKAQRFAQGERSLASMSSVAGLLALDLLGERAWPVLAHWFVTAPCKTVRDSPHAAGPALSEMIRRYPSTKQALRAACKAAGAHGESVKSEIEASLRSSAA